MILQFYGPVQLMLVYMVAMITLLLNWLICDHFMAGIQMTSAPLWRRLSLFFSNLFLLCGQYAWQIMHNLIFGTMHIHLNQGWWFSCMWTSIARDLALCCLSYNQLFEEEKKRKLHYRLPRRQFRNTNSSVRWWILTSMGGEGEHDPWDQQSSYTTPLVVYVRGF